MKTFDPNYKLLDEMYQDGYYLDFLVDKVKDELRRSSACWRRQEQESVQATLDEAVCGINDLQEVDEERQ